MDPDDPMGLRRSAAPVHLDSVACQRGARPQRAVTGGGQACADGADVRVSLPCRAGNHAAPRGLAGLAGHILVARHGLAGAARSDPHSAADLHGGCHLVVVAAANQIAVALRLRPAGRGDGGRSAQQVQLRAVRWRGRPGRAEPARGAPRAAGPRLVVGPRAGTAADSAPCRLDMAPLGRRHAQHPDQAAATARGRPARVAGRPGRLAEGGDRGCRALGVAGLVCVGRAGAASRWPRRRGQRRTGRPGCWCAIC